MESWLQPMLCSPVDEVPAGPEWVLEGKLDGWRSVTHVQADRSVALYGGRNGSNYSGKLPYIESALRSLVPPDSALDGELLGGEWGDVQGVMTRGAGAHVPSKAIPALTYVVFDVIRYNGEDVRGWTWEDRRAILETEVAFSRPDAAEHMRLSPVGDSSPETHARMLELGLEGSVCKLRTSRYQSGVKARTWVKIKAEATIDAKIIGFKEGTNSNAGQLGAFRVELPNGKETTCKVPTDQLRAAVTENPDLYLGRTIEVKHNGETSEGKVRHPRFLRFRDDLDGLSPRERQVMDALAATAEVKPTRKAQVKSMTAPATRKMRNYQAMGDAKLLKVLGELRYQGEAYTRCVERGSGNPEADLAVVEGLAWERGLEVPA